MSCQGYDGLWANTTFEAMGVHPTLAGHLHPVVSLGIIFSFNYGMTLIKELLKTLTLL